MEFVWARYLMIAAKELIERNSREDRGRRLPDKGTASASFGATDQDAASPARGRNSSPIRRVRSASGLSDPKVITARVVSIVRDLSRRLPVQRVASNSPTPLPRVAGWFAFGAYRGSDAIGPTSLSLRNCGLPGWRANGCETFAFA